MDAGRLNMLINDCNIIFLVLFLTRREVFMSKIRSFNLSMKRNFFFCWGVLVSFQNENENIKKAIRI